MGSFLSGPSVFDRIGSRHSTTSLKHKVRWHKLPHETPSWKQARDAPHAGSSPTSSVITPQSVPATMCVETAIVVHVFFDAAQYARLRPQKIERRPSPTPPPPSDGPSLCFPEPLCWRVGRPRSRCPLRGLCDILPTRHLPRPCCRADLKLGRARDPQMLLPRHRALLRPARPPLHPSRFR